MYLVLHARGPGLVTRPEIVLGHDRPLVRSRLIKAPNRSRLVCALLPVAVHRGEQIATALARRLAALKRFECFLRFFSFSWGLPETIGRGSGFRDSRGFVAGFSVDTASFILVHTNRF
jgi:hypothetical protein